MAQMMPTGMATAGSAMTPAMMSQAGFYSSILGAGASFGGAVGNSINARRTANINADLAGQQARDALDRGQSAEFNSRLKTAQLKGTQTAELAGHGVALDSGSPLDVLTSTDVMGSADALNIRNNAAKEAWGYDVQQSNYKAQASASNPWSAGLSSLITSAGSVGERWYKYKTLSNPGNPMAQQ